MPVGAAAASMVFAFATGGDSTPARPAVTPAAVAPAAPAAVAAAPQTMPFKVTG